MHQDFDLDTLATYLHLQAGQIARLADRGKLPGRKVGGRWRFSRAEIHHWLEDRIGLSDEKELAHVESALQRAGEKMVDQAEGIPALISLDTVAVPLRARTRRSVVGEMVRLATGTGMLWDPEKMVEAVCAREQMHPTALDNGAALLHPRRPMPSILGQPLLAVGITVGGIPFGHSGGLLTDIFFLICSTDDQGHLQTLARLSRMLTVDGFLETLRGVSSGAEVLDVMVEYACRFG
ncbi:MAG: PTS sugar transporter subunit IIA [Pirellulales bacterium]